MTTRAPTEITRQRQEAGKQIQYESFCKLRPESNLKRSLDAFVSNLKRILNAVTPPPIQPQGPSPQMQTSVWSRQRCIIHKTLLLENDDAPIQSWGASAHVQCCPCQHTKSGSLLDDISCLESGSCDLVHEERLIATKAFHYQKIQYNIFEVWTGTLFESKYWISPISFLI